MQISNEQFHDAVQFGDLATVKSVLDDDPAMVSFRFDSNDFPLHLAASRGHLGVAQFLIERGADVKAIGDQGMTAGQSHQIVGQYRQGVFLINGG